MFDIGLISTTTLLGSHICVPCHSAGRIEEVTVGCLSPVVTLSRVFWQGLHAKVSIIWTCHRISCSHVWRGGEMLTSPSSLTSGQSGFVTSHRCGSSWPCGLGPGHEGHPGSLRSCGGAGMEQATEVPLVTSLVSRHQIQTASQPTYHLRDRGLLGL